MFRETLDNDQFLQVLPSHVNDGSVTRQQVQKVLEKINKIIEC